MKKILIISLLAMFSAPGATYADWIDDMMEQARAGDGTVVESHSSASSGGQTVSGGESVTTGDVSASSHVETRINAGSDGGTVQVKVETSKNGVTETEEYSKAIEPDAGVHVKAEASATDEETNSEVSVNGEEMGASEGVVHTASATAAVSGDFSEFITETVPSFFKKVVDFFWWF